MARRCFAWYAVCALALAGAGAWAMPDMSHMRTVSMKITDVAVFKHGYGFVLSEGEAELLEGWCRLSEVPPAASGTLWFYAKDEGLLVDRTVARLLKYTVAQPRSRASFCEFLRTLHGTKPKITLTDGTTVSGRVLEVFPERGEVCALLVETPRGRLLVDVGRIWDISPEKQTPHGYQVQAKQEKALALRLRKADGGTPSKATVGMARLTAGIQWIPEYKLRVLDGRKVRLQLSATVINGLGRLEGANLHFVVGVPQFALEDQLSPLCLEDIGESLIRYIQREGERRYGRERYRVPMNVMAQRLAQAVQAPAGPAAQPEAPWGGYGAAEAVSEALVAAQVVREGADELFFYEVPDIELEVGDRALLDLLDVVVPYEDIYTWTIADPTTGREAEQLRRGKMAAGYAYAGELTQRAQIKHVLRLKNTSDSPWTTAYAMVVKDWRPISQSLLRYTPCGATADLETALAVNIERKAEEAEVSRKVGAFRVSGAEYDEIVIEGRITLRNRKDEELRIIVKRRFIGEVLSKDEQAQERRLPKLSSADVNPTSELTWDLKLPALGERELRYTYRLYIFRRELTEKELKGAQGEQQPAAQPPALGPQPRPAPPSGKTAAP